MNAMASNQSEVQALMERRSEAMRLKDIDRLMSVYSSDVVYFDLVPPLRYAGAPALRLRFLDWFGRWKSPIGQEIKDLTVLANEDLAAAHMLIRASGTLKGGQEVGYWLRTTDLCRRSDRGWVIAHEHVSLPVDMKSGLAVLDLVP